MRRGRTLFWAIIGSVVATVAVVIGLIHVDSGTSPKAASSPVPPISAGTSPQSRESAPVVTPQTSSTSTFSYLSDLHPSGHLGELVNRGPVEISGSIYPKSISFYCNVGDPTAFPAYKLAHNARRFQATIGLAAKSPPNSKRRYYWSAMGAHSGPLLSPFSSQKPSMSMSLASTHSSSNASAPVTRIPVVRPLL